MHHRAGGDDLRKIARWARRPIETLLLRSALLAILTARSLSVSSDARARIDRETDLERLERWITRATRATRVEELFDGEA